MTRPRFDPVAPAARRASSPRRAFTLVEMLVATTLTLLMMAAAVQIFALVGDSVSDSRATLEMNERLRAALRRLQIDLRGVTASMTPPLSPADDPGYFEYVEGPLGVTIQPHSIAADLDNGVPDTAVIDFDDILMFTTRSPDRPFVGRLNGAVVESPVAEVAWFVRGGRLYRRVLLVLPQATFSTGAAGFYQSNDVSAHVVSGTPVANTLGDLTRRENRYGHQPSAPHRAFWGNYTGLPTLGETSNASWTLGTTSGTATVTTPIDFLTDPRPQDGALAAVGPRVYEDVILDHVIGFDVKAWDPRAPLQSRSGTVLGYGNYVDLGSGVQFAASGTQSAFDSTSLVDSMTYDTWSTAYDHASGGAASDGFDSGGAAGVVDDLGERSPAARPPYRVPLRGIQVKIRVREPSSRQVREVTLVQDFLPK